MKIVKISPKTNFHTYLHSDTLWGNLVYAYKLLYGEKALENLLENYLKGNIPFVVSSVFPYEIIKNYSVTNQLLFLNLKSINKCHKLLTNQEANHHNRPPQLSNYQFVIFNFQL